MKDITPGLIFDEEKHKYTVNGKRTTSVTTVINGGIPKNLTAWAARIAAEKAWELRDMIDQEAFIRIAKDEPNALRDKAGVRGSAIHDIAEKYVHGIPVEVPDELYPYVDGYARFLDRFAVSPILTEKSVYLAEFNCAGRFDAIGLIPSLNDGPVMIDWKTSNGIYKEVKVQTAAYSLADFYVEPDAPEAEIQLPEVQATYVAHITPDGTFLHPLARNRAEIREHFEFFRAAHKIYTFGLVPHKHVADPIPAPSIEFEEAS